jgi:hypothetical protein
MSIKVPEKIQIRQVVIWGYKLHSHTHSYIHNGFYRAFQHADVPVFWLDDTDDVSKIDLTHTLFITEHMVNKRIPCRTDCLYLSHYVDPGDFPGVPRENILAVRVSGRDFTESDKDPAAVERTGQPIKYTELSYGEKWEYHAQVEGIHSWYTYWATDLLPYEITHNIQLLERGELDRRRDVAQQHQQQESGQKVINFVGLVEDTWYLCSMICLGMGWKFVQHGATFSAEDPRNRTVEENAALIQQSWIAPAFQSDHQIKHKYIPCRIFKNISYGRIGVTNNPAVRDLLNYYLQTYNGTWRDVAETPGGAVETPVEGPTELLFDTDVGYAMRMANWFEESPPNVRWPHIKRMMEMVRDHHTYMNRISTLAGFIEEFSGFSLHLNL